MKQTKEQFESELASEKERMIETIEKLLKDKKELGDTLSSLQNKQEDF